MILDLSTLLIKDAQMEELYNQPSLQLPVTIIDLERGPIVDMHHHLADPCPDCGAFNMFVGDWVCYGRCSPCEHATWKGRDPYA